MRSAARVLGWDLGGSAEVLENWVVGTDCTERRRREGGCWMEAVCPRLRARRRLEDVRGKGSDLVPGGIGLFGPFLPATLV